MLSFRRFLPSLARAATTLALVAVAAGAAAQTKWDPVQTIKNTNQEARHIAKAPTFLKHTSDTKEGNL